MKNAEHVNMAASQIKLFVKRSVRKNGSASRQRVRVCTGEDTGPPASQGQTMASRPITPEARQDIATLGGVADKAHRLADSDPRRAQGGRAARPPTDQSEGWSAVTKPQNAAALLPQWLDAKSNRPQHGQYYPQAIGDAANNCAILITAPWSRHCRPCSPV
jgi:hypothetical protein